jgi:hypothetical protein
VSNVKPGLRWSRFAAEAGDIANDIANLIHRFRFAFVGTIRQDGTPRISPVETHVVDQDLVMVMIPRTRKAADLRRDNRVVLQSRLSIERIRHPSTSFEDGACVLPPIAKRPQVRSRRRVAGALVPIGCSLHWSSRTRRIRVGMMMARPSCGGG